ncbi:hypothetical protein [Nevskia soli]|uniref:hypothetical protein n=1 Tax=Nevskia soli TaxID=418856 RepID=UPI0012F923C2|nr:hypothetical protein [Nevskia soli]
MSRNGNILIFITIICASTASHAQGPITTSQLTVSQAGLPGITIQPSYQGQSFPGVILNSPGQGLVFTKTGGAGAGPEDAADVFINRAASYSGGNSRSVNAPLKIADTVSAGARSYEWSLSSIMDNSSTSTDASQNNAGYFHTYKRSSGASWATTEELDDLNPNPITPSVTDEKDLVAVGADTFGGSPGARVIEDLFATSYDGNPATVAWGIRLNTDANTTVVQGMRFNGNFTRGIDFTGGNFTGGSLVLTNGQKICFDGTACTTYLWRADGVLYYHTSNGNVVSINDIGQISATVFSTPAGVGVSCSGPPTANFAVANGIVTHC